MHHFLSVYMVFFCFVFPPVKALVKNKILLKSHLFEANLQIVAMMWQVVWDNFQMIVDDIVTKEPYPIVLNIYFKKTCCPCNIFRLVRTASRTHYCEIQKDLPSCIMEKNGNPSTSYRPISLLGPHYDDIEQ